MAHDKLVSNKIKFYLDQLNMSQQELADIIQVDKSFISRIISGERPSITLGIALKISEVLGQHIEEVFNYKEE